MFRRRDGIVTPAMLEALRRLSRGEPARCGRTTRQRLDREGLAIYEPTFSFEENLWDREMQITKKGKKVLSLFHLFGGLRIKSSTLFAVFASAGRSFP